MSEVKRYQLMFIGYEDADLYEVGSKPDYDTPTHDGPWVLATDYEVLKAERDRLAAELADTREALESRKRHVAECGEQIDRLFAENDRLAAELATAQRDANTSAFQRDSARADARRLREALTDARKWIGDGPFSDGLHRDLWTKEYKAAVDKVDEALRAAAAEPPATGGDLAVTCARCGVKGTSATFVIEEGDEWECPACWERCEAKERGAVQPGERLP